MKNLKHFFYLLGIVFLTGTLFSCSQNAPTEVVAVTPSSTRIPTSTPQPTFTPSPTASITPTVTPFAGITLSTPHMVYLRGDLNNWVFVFLDLNDFSSRILSLPDQPDLDFRHISPDGKWLAFYSSSSTDNNEYWASRSNLSINIMNLETTEIVRTIQIRADDSSARFEETARLIGDPSIEAHSIEAHSIEEAFWHGIFSLDWSPDSRYLAFAAQIDGLSSDVYLYDTLNKTLKQVTSGDKQVSSLEWSPTGKWILNTAQESNTLDARHWLYATNPFNGETYAGGGADKRYWLDEDTFIYLGGIHIWGGGVVDIPQGSFNTFAFFYTSSSSCVDPETGYAVMDGFFDSLPSTDDGFGLFLVNMLSGSKTRIDDSSADTRIFCAFRGDKRFLVRTNWGTYFLTTRGEKIPYSIPFSGTISFSPYSDHYLIYGSGVKVYNGEDQLLFDGEYQTSNNSQVIWRPDGKGVFFSAISESGDSLYYFDFEQNNITLIDSAFYSGEMFIFPNGLP